MMADKDVKLVDEEAETAAIIQQIAQRPDVDSDILVGKYPDASQARERDLERALIESKILDDLGIIIGGEKVGDRTKDIRASLKALRS